MNSARPRSLVTFALVLPLAFASCGTVYYKAMESIGYAKRDLLVERVEEARESQAEAKQEFQTTFEAFKSLTGFEGGELEKKYKELDKAYNRSKDSAAEVTSRIASIDKVATDMFKEWQKEIGEIESASLKQKSEQLKLETERGYGKLLDSMRTAEQRMQPVLTAFKDHTLFLKHNLNAAAITSLQDELVSIESSVDVLIREMQSSIDEADAFLSSLEKAPAGS